MMCCLLCAGIAFVDFVCIIFAVSLLGFFFVLRDRLSEATLTRHRKLMLHLAALLLLVRIAGVSNIDSSGIADNHID